MNVCPSVLPEHVRRPLQPLVLRRGHARLVIDFSQLFILAPPGLVVFQQIHPVDADIFRLEKRRDLADVRITGVHALNQRQAEVDLPPVRAQPPQILQNQPVVRAGVPPVVRRIQQLEVVEKGVRVGQHPLEMGIGDVAAGVDIHRDALVTEKSTL